MVFHSARKELSKPSFPRFVIALFLVKSKPVGLLVADYLQALQACITQGPRAVASADAQHHVDSSALWHEKYKKSEESQIELRARISELESLNSNAKAEIPLKILQPKKRKICVKDPEQTLDTNVRKRLRTSAVDSASQSLEHSLKIVADELHTSAFDYGGSNLPQHFYTLQKLASTGNPSGHDLAIALSQIFSDIRLIISSVKASSPPNVVAVRNVTTRSLERSACKIQANAGQELDIKLSVIGYIFPCLLNATSQLTEGTRGALAQPRVIHGIIGLLRDVLERLLSLAAENNENSLVVKDQISNKPNSKAPTLPDENVMRLCRLIIRLVACLDFRKAADQEVLDGFLFFLLGRVGSMLNLFVFGDDSNEILRPVPASQIMKTESVSYEQERKTAEVQGPYLVYILEQIIPLAHQHRTSMTRHACDTPQLSGPQSNPARLSHPTWATLQSTLLAAVFGAQAGGEFTGALADPLANDVAPDAHLSVGPDVAGLETAECVADWFKAEVWRVLGWEVLGGKIAWEG